MEKEPFSELIVAFSTIVMTKNLARLGKKKTFSEYTSEQLIIKPLPLPTAPDPKFEILTTYFRK